MNNKLLITDFKKVLYPFLVYLATTIIYLSFFKDVVRVGFRWDWLIVRLLYLPVVLLSIYISEKYLKEKWYELPVLVSTIYISSFVGFFSLTTAGLASSYFFGLVQFYFGIALMPLTRKTFFLSLLFSLIIFCGINLYGGNFQGEIDLKKVSNYIPLIAFSVFIHILLFRIRNKKYEAEGKLNSILQNQKTLIQKQARKISEAQKLLILKEISAQVAHDIRSPLAALDMIVNDIDDVEEQKRVIMRSSVSRINDIANQLISTYNNDKEKSFSSEKLEIVLLSGVIESILSEKRTQFRGKLNIQIISNLGTSSYGLFSEINTMEFKRIISNLINNSVEAFGNEEGVITLSLKEDDLSNIVLSIKDNGKGIAPHILKELGQRGKTFGKDGGSGLGLYHAQTTLKSWGGSFHISSQLNSGTEVTLLLAKAQGPDSFLSGLHLLSSFTVVIMDDDNSIHQVWKKRFEEIEKVNSDFKLVHFTDCKLFEKWIQEGGCANLYLVDFEFLGQEENGISLIETLNIKDKSILVTSRFEEKNIIKDCNRLELKLLPNGLAAYIPITIEKELETEEPKELATILLDDDDLVRMIWDLSAKKKDIDLKAFSEPQELFDNLDSFSKESIFYIDSDLSKNQKGEDIVKELYEKGFLNLHMATGYEASKFSHLKEVKSIIGKLSPW